MFVKSGNELSKLYTDHAADGGLMLAVLDELHAGWEAAQQRAIELRFELKESLTAEEWAAVFWSSSLPCHPAYTGSLKESAQNDKSTIRIKGFG